MIFLKEPSLNALIVPLMSSAKAGFLSKKGDSSQYSRFSNALRKVLQVSHSDMKEMLAAEKKAKASKPRPSSRVSRDKD
jgi:hypothetical protein